MRRGKVKEWRKVRQFRVTLRFYDPQIANKEREERKLVRERLEKLGDIGLEKMENESRLLCVSQYISITKLELIIICKE